MLRKLSDQPGKVKPGPRSGSGRCPVPAPSAGCAPALGQTALLQTQKTAKMQIFVGKAKRCGFFNLQIQNFRSRLPFSVLRA